MSKSTSKVYVFLAIFILVTFINILLSSCNAQIIDTTYEFDYAYITLPNGDCVEGKVDSWRDYEDGDQLQITIDGITYLTDTTRAILVKEK